MVELVDTKSTNLGDNMYADDIQILYEEIALYDIFQESDDKQKYIGTTHIPDIAITFCAAHKDCIIRKRYTTMRLMQLEKEYNK